MNVLYVGIDNPIDIAAEGILNKDLIVRISKDGTIAPVTDKAGYYNVRIYKVGIAVISVWQKLKHGKEKLLREQKFRVKRIPDPVVYLGNRKGDIILRNNLPYAKGLHAQLDGFDFDMKFIIKSFTLTTCKNGLIQVTENLGGQFSNEILSIIGTSTSGDVLLFDNILVQHPDGTARKLNPLIYHIDGYISRKCDSNEIRLPMYPVTTRTDSTEENIAYYRTTLNCSCDCIDEAKGNYKEGRKDGWWEYNKITDRETTTVRKEFYNKDTVTQQFYEDGIMVKRVNLVGKRQYGTYDEYYPNGVQKIHGQYVIDTIAADSVMQINPITLEENLVIDYRWDSVRNGEWFFYNTDGILARKEVYEPKKNRWVIDK